MLLGECTKIPASGSIELGIAQCVLVGCNFHSKQSGSAQHNFPRGYREGYPNVKGKGKRVDVSSESNIQNPKHRILCGSLHVVFFHLWLWLARLFDSASCCMAPRKRPAIKQSTAEDGIEQSEFAHYYLFIYLTLLVTSYYVNVNFIMLQYALHTLYTIYYVPCTI